MIFHFYKYQGTGNDFIIADNRQKEYSSITNDQVRRLCDRRFGIGADGLMLLNEKTGYDFEMKYFNSEGRVGSMCGNGGRCMIKFAYHLGIHKELYKFTAIDGEHEGEIDTDGIISLKIKDVDKVRKFHSDFIVDTGSPHYIKMVPDLMAVDVIKKGHEIRHSKEFNEEGINVNFVEQSDEVDKISVRTYERGVEDETYSCGSGATACALVVAKKFGLTSPIKLSAPGGKLEVEFETRQNGTFHNIFLTGPVQLVFETWM